MRQSLSQKINLLDGLDTETQLILFVAIFSKIQDDHHIWNENLAPNTQYGGHPHNKSTFYVVWMLRNSQKKHDGWHFFYMCIIVSLRWSFWYNIHWAHLVCDLSYTHNTQTYIITYYCSRLASSEQYVEKFNIAQLSTGL